MGLFKGTFIGGLISGRGLYPGRAYICGAYTGEAYIREGFVCGGLISGELTTRILFLSDSDSNFTSW